MRDEELSWFSAKMAEDLGLTLKDDMKISEIALGIDKAEVGYKYPIFLCKAILHNSTYLVETLLANGADPNCETPTGSLPLNAAVQNGSISMIELLLDAGADPNLVGDNEWAPLGHAVAYGKNEVIELLLERGADPNTKDKVAKINQTVYGIYRASPLHWCVTDINSLVRKRLSHKILLKHGADLEAVDNRKFTPLIFAADRNNYWIVDDLIEAGANLDALNNKKKSAAHIAAEKDHGKILEPLIRAGANLRLEDKNGLTVASTAAANGSLNCLKLIQELLPDQLYASDADGDTASHHAAARNQDEALQFISKHSDNIDAQNKMGWTPLMVAATNRYQSSIHLLVELGASLEIKDKKGNTAVDLAKEFSPGVVLKALQGYLK